MSVPEAVWNEIKALKQEHAELEQKVDALAATSVKLLTAEGERFLNMSLKVDVLSDRVRAIESPASGVLGVVVDGGDLQPFVGGFTESPAPAPDPVCASCKHPEANHYEDGRCCYIQPETGRSFCRCPNFVPTAGPAPLDPVRMNLSEVVLSYVSMCGVRAWDEYGGRMIEIFGDGQSIQSLYIKNDSRQEIADLILGRDGAR